MEDISFVSWNRQVQHILASANPSGRASVWDLRKNDLIIKVSDHSNRVCLLSPLPYGFLHDSLAVCRATFSCVLRPCVSLDALLWVSLEPRSSNTADLGLWGWPDACHPDVGFTFCYLSSQDFRESHTVNNINNVVDLPSIFFHLYNISTHKCTVNQQGRSFHCLEFGWSWVAP